MDARRLWLATAVVASVTTAVALATAGASFVLAQVYFPAAEAVQLELLTHETATSVRWSRGHHLAAWLLLMLSLASLALTSTRLVTSGRTRRSLTTTGASLVTVVAAALSLATRKLVRWDQLALHTVSIGEDLSGYRAALHDIVRSILIDTREVTPTAYAIALTVHLAAPIAAAIASTITATSTTRNPPPPNAPHADQAPKERGRLGGSGEAAP